ncbi:MAG TPA: hypothetical protein VGP07_01475 [Polyangia bacterium]|jgi:hypothetical protein
MLRLAFIPARAIDHTMRKLNGTANQQRAEIPLISRLFRGCADAAVHHFNDETINVDRRAFAHVRWPEMTPSDRIALAEASAKMRDRP